MTRNERRRRGWLSALVSPVLRPALWSALLGAVVGAVLATPVYAEAPLFRAEPPLPSSVPDTGARPPSIPVQLPGTTPTAPRPPVPVVSGPLATEIYQLEIEVATLGEQLLTLRQIKLDALGAVATSQWELAYAREALARAEQLAEIAAAEALKDAAALPPGTFGSDLHGLGLLSRLERGQRDPGETTGPARELARTQAAEQAASAAFAAANTRAQLASSQFDAAERTFRQREAALVALKKKNVDQLIAIEREREAAEQRLGREIDTDDIVGLAAHPRALAAVRYALAQLGDPYLWAAEGPDRFDCSGLMWAAYRSKGADYFDLPRVSRDQYWATRHKQVSRSALLPGDLLFFASGSSPSSIHHVGMYIGGGKMVHAPTTGDVVKISTVWWSRFYGATRIFGAVPAPEDTEPGKDQPGGDKPGDDKPGGDKPGGGNPEPPTEPAPEEPTPPTEPSLPANPKTPAPLPPPPTRSTPSTTSPTPDESAQATPTTAPSGDLETNDPTTEPSTELSVEPTTVESSFPAADAEASAGS